MTEPQHDHDGPCAGVQVQFSALAGGDLEVVETPLGFGGPAMVIDFLPESTPELVMLRVRSGAMGAHPVECALEMFEMAAVALQALAQRNAAEAGE